MNKFKDFKLNKEILDNLISKGYESPTQIQQEILPIIMNEKDHIVGISKTGSGKTGAFSIPILNDINEEVNKPQALIIVPTRELSLQIVKEMDSIKPKHLNIVCVYGGASIDKQRHSLKKGAHVVVGTPGRLIDLIERKSLNLKDIKYLVLDEADHMLDLGFIEDIEKIISHTNESKRTFLFSATMPRKILELTQKYIPNHKYIEVPSKHDKKSIKQLAMRVKETEKIDTIRKFIEKEPFFYGIIFCRMKKETEEITKELKRTHRIEFLHGDMRQSTRERILKAFRNEKLDILVTTDVAARGIDIDNISHVINYSFSDNLENYVHRIGRTGRAGKEGVALSLLNNMDFRKMNDIENRYDMDIEYIPSLNPNKFNRQEKNKNSKFEKREKSDFKDRDRKRFDKEKSYRSDKDKNSRFDKDKSDFKDRDKKRFDRDKKSDYKDRDSKRFDKDRNSRYDKEKDSKFDKDKNKKFDSNKKSSGKSVNKSSSYRDNKDKDKKNGFTKSKTYDNKKKTNNTKKKVVIYD